MKGFAQLAVAFLLPLIGGCIIEPFAEPIPVAPASYTPQPPVPTQVASVPASQQGAPTTLAVSLPAPEQVKLAIDSRTRDQAGQLILSNLLKRYPQSHDRQLADYLVLVGSLLNIHAARGESDYSYVLLETDQALSGAIAPSTIFISKGLLHRMEDESELAGVLAREIANLKDDRAFRAAGIVVQKQATSQPATRATSQPSASPQVQEIAARVGQMIISGGWPMDYEQAADLDGARLAAEAKYAPDGYLRLLTRLKSVLPSTPDWSRIKALDGNVALIARAHPGASVKLPARFESFVKK